MSNWRNFVTVTPLLPIPAIIPLGRSPYLSSAASELRHQILSIMFPKCQTRDRDDDNNNDDDDDDDAEKSRTWNWSCSSHPLISLSLSLHISLSLSLSFSLLLPSLSISLSSRLLPLLIPVRHCLNSQKRSLEIPRRYGVQRDHHCTAASPGSPFVFTCSDIRSCQVYVLENSPFVRSSVRAVLAQSSI